MSNKGNTSVLTLGLRTTNIEKHLKGLEKGFSTAAVALGKIDKKFGKVNERLNKTKAILLKQNAKLEQQIKGLIERLNQLEWQLKQTRTFVSKLNQSHKALTKQVKTQGKEIEKKNKRDKIQNKRIDSLNKRLKESTSLFGSLNSVMRNFGRTAIGLVTAGGIYMLWHAFKGLIGQARAFEEAMVGVAKTTNLDKFKLGELKTRVQGISIDYGNPREHVGEISRLGGQLGIRGVDDLALFTEKVTQLELATNLSSTAGATSLARVLKLTGTSIAEGTHRLANAYISLGNRFAAIETEIATRTLDLAPVLGRFGYAPDVVAAFGTAAALSQVQSQSLATALNKLLIGLDQVTGSFDETNEGMRGLLTIFPDQSASQIRSRVAARDESFLVDLISRLREFDPLSQQSLLQTMGLSDVRTQKALYAILPLIQETYDASIAARTGVQDIDIEVARRRESYYNRLDVATQRALNMLDSVGYKLLGFTANLMEGISALLPVIVAPIEGILHLLGMFGQAFVALWSTMIGAPKTFTSMRDLGNHIRDMSDKFVTEALRTAEVLGILDRARGGPEKEAERQKDYNLVRMLTHYMQQQFYGGWKAMNDRFLGVPIPPLVGPAGWNLTSDPSGPASFNRQLNRAKMYSAGDPLQYINYQNTPIAQLAEMVEQGKMDMELYRRLVNDKAWRNKEPITKTMSDLQDLANWQVSTVKWMESIGALEGGYLTEHALYPEDNRVGSTTVRQFSDWKNAPLSVAQGYVAKGWLPKAMLDRYLASENIPELTVEQERRKRAADAKAKADEELAKAEEKAARDLSFRLSRSQRMGGFDPRTGEIMSRGQFIAQQLDHQAWQAERQQANLVSAGERKRAEQERQLRMRIGDARKTAGFDPRTGEVLSQGEWLARQDDMRQWEKEREEGRYEAALEMRKQELDRLREERLEREQKILTDLKSTTDVIGDSMGQLAIGAIELSEFLVNIFTDVRNKLVQRFISEPLSEGLTNLLGDGLISIASGGAGTAAARVPGTTPIPVTTRLAEGGTVIAPGLALVGEEGPEILSLPKNAQVTPLDVAGIAGGLNMTLNVNDTIDPGVFQRILDERTNEIIARAEEALVNKLRGNSQVAQAFRR